VQIRAVERWLDEGWSPWRITIGIASFIVLAVAVYGYASHPHHPGAVWWLAAALAVIALWALSEAARWRIRYKRLQSTAPASPQPTVNRAPLPATATTGEARSDALAKLRDLYEKGRKLQARISSRGSRDTPPDSLLLNEVVTWESKVRDALTDWPDLYVRFGNVPEPHPFESLNLGEIHNSMGQELEILKDAINRLMQGSSTETGSRPSLGTHMGDVRYDPLPPAD
jgi:hypothetical protein